MIQVPPIDCERVAANITTWITAKAQKAEASGAVVGLSGGIDSAVTAKLCAAAFGGEVLALILPDDVTMGEVEEAKKLASVLGIRQEVIPLMDIIKAFLPRCTGDRKALGNVKARIRMILLYNRANCLNRLVVGSGNKSELLLGYFTKYGDGGCDLLPLGDLYKTQVWELAAYLKIPREVREKKPSAGLWEGQTDEAELGLSYETLDRVLGGLARSLSMEDIAKDTGLSLSEVRRVAAMVDRSAHKRALPPYPLLNRANERSMNRGMVRKRGKWGVDARK